MSRIIKSRVYILSTTLRHTFQVVRLLDVYSVVRPINRDETTSTGSPRRSLFDGSGAPV